MKTFLVTWLLALGVLLAACIWFFWRPGVEVFTDGGSAMLGFVPERAAAPPDSDGSGTRRRIDPEINNLHNVVVGPLAFQKLPSGNLSLSFDLTNVGGVNDYPGLLVTIFDRARTVVRRVTLKPDDYFHTGSLVKAHIQFELAPLPGETSLQVQPVYLELEKTEPTTAVPSHAEAPKP